MRILAKDLMTKDPVTISQEASVKRAVEVMLRRNVGSLLVVEKDEIVGIITEKDIISKVVRYAKDPRKVKVKNIMTKKLITIHPTADIYEIAKVMSEKNVRRLPVCEGNKLLGLVTEKDILKFAPSVIYILSERIKIRKRKRKRSSSGQLGICEICGNYSDNLREYKGMLICEYCFDLVK